MANAIEIPTPTQDWETGDVYWDTSEIADVMAPFGDLASLRCAAAPLCAAEPPASIGLVERVHHDQHGREQEGLYWVTPFALPADGGHLLLCEDCAVAFDDGDLVYVDGRFTRPGES